MDSRIGILDFTKQGQRIAHRREHQYETEGQIPDPRKLKTASRVERDGGLYLVVRFAMSRPSKARVVNAA